MLGMKNKKKTAMGGIGIAVLTGVGTVRDAMISMYNDVIVPALS